MSEAALISDQIVIVTYIPKGRIFELVTVVDIEKEEKINEYFFYFYPQLIHKDYNLNISNSLSFLAKISSCCGNQNALKVTVVLGENFQKQLDKEIGLKRLPICIGGVNPIPLSKYKNFFDLAFEKSFIDGRLGF